MQRPASRIAQTLPKAHDVHLVTLGLDREIFAVPVDAVVEILDLRPLCRIPDMPRSVAGLIDVRGTAVPVIDLRAKLGLPPIAATASTRILVLDIVAAGRRLVLGLIADRVFEVLTLERAQIDPPPEFGGGCRSSSISGLGRRDGEFVLIFDLERLFTADEVDTLKARLPELANADAIP